MSRGAEGVKVVCFNNACRFNVDGECSRSEVRVDELGMCIDARVTTQYPQEKLREKRKRPTGKAGAL